MEKQTKIPPQMEEAMKLMASVKAEDIQQDFRPFMVIYKDGRIQRFIGTATVLAGTDPLTGVISKDVVISPENDVYVRLYKPANLTSGEKVPLLIYFHGGGFCIESASSPTYHHHLNTLSLQANIVIVSVNYRLAPEHPLPAAYEDSWSAIKWVSGELSGENSGEVSGDTWLKEHADGGRLYFAGDSAGANIAHNMAKRIAKTPLAPLRLTGVVLVHPFFWGEERIGSEEKRVTSGSGMASDLWKFVCPGTSGSDDPLINPAKDPELVGVGGERVLVLVAEKDALRDRGFHYKEALVGCGWNGKVEVVETIGEDHVFHLLNPGSDNAGEMVKRVVEFFNSSS